MAVVSFHRFEYDEFGRHLLEEEKMTMRDGTRVVRAGLPQVEQGEPFLPGPTFAGA